MLYARVTEADILQGSLVDPGSFLKRVAVKLTSYDGEVENPYQEHRYFTDYEYACHLNKEESAAKVVSQVLDAYQINCTNIHNIEAKQLDALIESYEKKQDLNSLTQIICLVRKASCQHSVPASRIVEDICRYIMDNLESDEDVEPAVGAA